MHGDKKRKKMCCEKKRDEEGEGRKVKRKRIQYHKPEKNSFLYHPTLKTEMEPEGGEEFLRFSRGPQMHLESLLLIIK